MADVGGEMDFCVMPRNDAEDLRSEKACVEGVEG